MQVFCVSSYVTGNLLDVLYCFAHNSVTTCILNRSSKGNHVSSKKKNSISLYIVAARTGVWGLPYSKSNLPHSTVVCTGHSEITVFLNRDKISIIEL